MLATSRWYHVAVVFDCTTRHQTVYLNGVIDNTRLATTCFQGSYQSLTIGGIDTAGSIAYFEGLIDQLSYTNRPKTSGEILRDATLTVHFSFDKNSTVDQGPLQINGSLVGNTSFIVGRVGQALDIGNLNQSYMKLQGLVLLGTTGRPYSLVMWINPHLQQESSIIHMSHSSDGSPPYWCMSVFCWD